MTIQIPNLGATRSTTEIEAYKNLGRVIEEIPDGEPLDEYTNFVQGVYKPNLDGVSITSFEGDVDLGDGFGVSVKYKLFFCRRHKYYIIIHNPNLPERGVTEYLRDTNIIHLSGRLDEWCYWNWYSDTLFKDKQYSLKRILQDYFQQFFPRHERERRMKERIEELELSLRKHHFRLKTLANGLSWEQDPQLVARTFIEENPLIY